MLTRKAETILFVLIFIICGCLVGSCMTNYYFNEFPINQGRTPVQLIEQENEFVAENDLDYKYIIKDGYLFYHIDGSYSIDGQHITYGNFAWRNKNSGFIFKSNAPFYLNSIKLTDEKTAVLHIKRFGSDYVVYIDGKKNDDIIYYNGDKIMDALTFNDARGIVWFDVITDISEFQEITYKSNGKMTTLFDKEDLINHLGVSE